MAFNFKKAFGVALNSFKSQYLPVKDNKLAMTWNGEIAVADKNNEGSYIAFGKDGKARRYPEMMVMKLPIFFISRPVDQIKAGDVIKQNNGYYNVTAVKEGKISTRSYTGFGHTVIPVEDVILGNSLVPVAINLFGIFGNGQQNPFTAVQNGGGMFGGMMGMMFMSQFFGGKDKDGDDEELQDEFTDMDRHGLKLYSQKNDLGIRVVPSMSDEDLRNAVREKLGRETSESFGGGDMASAMLMANLMNGGNNTTAQGMFGGMNPLVLMLLNDKKGSNQDDLMMLVMMSSMGNLQAMNTPATATPAPQPVEVFDPAAAGEAPADAPADETAPAEA